MRVALRLPRGFPVMVLCLELGIAPPLLLAATRFDGFWRQCQYSSDDVMRAAVRTQYDLATRGRGCWLQRWLGALPPARLPDVDVAGQGLQPFAVALCNTRITQLRMLSPTASGCPRHTALYAQQYCFTQPGDLAQIYHWPMPASFWRDYLTIIGGCTHLPANHWHAVPYIFRLCPVCQRMSGQMALCDAHHVLVHCQGVSGMRDMHDFTPAFASGFHDMHSWLASNYTPEGLRYFVDLVTSFLRDVLPEYVE
jgi:hypothetical protein